MFSRWKAAVLAVVIVGSVLGVGSPADAASAIQIVKVQYDSPGSDSGSNSSLNAEWVLIRNTGSANRSLTGWTLRDPAGHVYRFPTFTLKAGASVYVHTGTGAATSAHRYQNRSWYVWNNTGDTAATLKSAAGNVADTCRWTSVGTGSKTC